MRLIRIKLKRSVPFWTIPNIFLNIDNPISEPIDIDSLKENLFNIVDKSMKLGEINAFDMQGKKIKSINDLVELNEYSVSEDDIIEEENSILDVESVTVSMDEEDDDFDSVRYESKDFTDKALIVVNNNGNTVKRTVSAIDKNDPESKALLNACLIQEKSDKNRSGVIKVIKNILKEI